MIEVIKPAPLTSVSAVTVTTFNASPAVAVALIAPMEPVALNVEPSIALSVASAPFAIAMMVPISPAVAVKVVFEIASLVSEDVAFAVMSPMDAPLKALTPVMAEAPLPETSTEISPRKAPTLLPS